jgi:hypothetical protein
MVKQFLDTILLQQKQVRWTIILFAGYILLWIWDAAFLNPLSYNILRLALAYSIFSAGLSVVIAVTVGWGIGVSLYFLAQKKMVAYVLSITFIINLLRSIPQIIGLLIGYSLLTFWLAQGSLESSLIQIIWMTSIIGLFCSLEIIDLVTERIAYFKQLDFFSAMLSSGISEIRIINIEILGKSSRAHLMHKAVSLFGVAILLQCSIDFVISVGLSNDVSLVNVPTTLGSVLAKLDSKQDILALGSIISNPSYIPELFFQHLQGVSVVFLIVFTLLCIYQIADGIIQQYDL